MRKKQINQVKKTFEDLVEPYILLGSFILFIVTFIVMCFISFNVAISILISYVLSCLIFLKNNFVLTKALNQEFMKPRLWITMNHLLNGFIYILLVLLFYKVKYFNLFGLAGLFFVSLSTIIIGVFKKK